MLRFSVLTKQLKSSEKLFKTFNELLGQCCHKESPASLVRRSVVINLNIMCDFDFSTCFYISCSCNVPNDHTIPCTDKSMNISKIYCEKRLKCYPGVLQWFGKPCKCLTPRIRVLFYEPFSKSRKSPPFKEHEDSLPWSQELVNWPLPETDESSPHSKTTFSESRKILPPMSSLLGFVISIYISTKFILYFLFFPINAISWVHIFSLIRSP